MTDQTDRATGPALERKLTTILSADVAEFSRLMAEDEEQTLLAFQARRQVIDSLVILHRGRIFNTAGDAVLAEFASAVEAVRCATEIQAALHTLNDHVPLERQVRFRIGVNLGDVMVQGSDLLGDGVNVAARLQSAAEPGGICISGSVYDQIINKLSLSFKSLGEMSYKNIPQPVRTFSIIGAEGHGTLPSPRPARQHGRNTAPFWLAAALTLILAATAGSYWTYTEIQRGKAEQARIFAEAEAGKQEAAQREARLTAEEAQRRADTERQAAEAAQRDAQAASDRAKADAERQKLAAQARTADEGRRQADADRVKAEAEARRLIDAEREKSEAAAQIAPATPPVARFDGVWIATFVCPPVRNILEFSVRFTTVIRAGHLEAQYGFPSHPASMTFKGEVNADGKFSLHGSGLSGPPQYTGQPAGTPMSLDLAGEIGDRAGSGRRLNDRDCSVEFARQEAAAQIAATPPVVRFDGAWIGTLNCPSVGNTLGFSYKFTTVIRAGHLEAQRGVPGQPASITYKGDVSADGKFSLHGSGLSGQQRFSGMSPGTPVSLHLEGKIGDRAGAGRQINGRGCSVEFARQ
jgi:class 3 adenylate cyclase